MINFDLYEDEVSEEDKALAEAGRSIASQIDQMIYEQILGDYTGKMSKVHTPQGVITLSNGDILTYELGSGW
jgi:hypothetical protein